MSKNETTLKELVTMVEQAAQGKRGQKSTDKIVLAAG